MGKIFMRLAIVAGALLLSGSLASAGNPIHCAGFVTAALINVQQIRAAASSAGGGCTGHNLQDPFWSADRNVQRRWCLSVRDETADTRISEMREAVAKCSYCNAYANTITTAAAANIKYGCGFKDDGDKRWSPDKDHHFNGCMVARDCSEICVLWSCYDACVEEVGTIRKILDPIASQVTLAVAQCKAEKGVGTSSSALTKPKGFQDSIQRPKHPAKIGSNSRSGPTDSINRKATLPRGSTTSSNALAQPSGGTARRAADPCQSPTATKPCKPSGKPATKGGNAAMDRLSGDNQLPSSSNPSSKTGDGGRGRLPTGGGTSAVAKPVTTPAALPKADPTTDFGKCASCGKPPAPPR